MGCFRTALSSHVLWLLFHPKNQVKTCVQGPEAVSRGVEKTRTARRGDRPGLRRKTLGPGDRSAAWPWGLRSPLGPAPGPLQSHCAISSKAWWSSSLELPPQGRPRAGTCLLAGKKCGTEKGQLWVLDRRPQDL